MSLSEYLPLKDENLNELLPQLDLDFERLKEKLKSGVDLEEVNGFLKTLREVASRVDSLMSPLRADLEKYLKDQMDAWEKNSLGGTSDKEMEINRELNNLIYLKQDILEIKRSVLSRLRELNL